MFTALARAQAQSFWEGSYNHPFVLGLQEGSLEEGVFRYYLLQDRYYLIHFSRIHDLIARQTKHSEVASLMRTLATDLEMGEGYIRQQFFQELGISQEEIEGTPIAPTAYHYVSHMYRQLVDGTPNVAFAAILPCVWLYHDIGERLLAQGSPNPLYQRWIETYAGAEGATMVQQSQELIDSVYQSCSPKEQEEMLVAFCRSAELEWLFWEMAMTHEEWPQF